MEDLRILFFFYIIQAILMIVAGNSFFGIKKDLGRVLLAASLYGISIWLIRGLYDIYQIPLGSHTLILAFIFFVLVHLIFRQHWSYSLGITCFSLCLVMLGGGLVGLGIKMSGLTVEYIFNNVWLHIIFGHLENTLLLVYLVINNLIGLSIASISE